MNEGTSAAAGWYDDGSGRLRWWDGTRWTDDYQAIDNQAVDDQTISGPLTANVAPAPTAGASKGAPWALLALIAGIVAILLGLVPVLGALLGAAAIVFAVLALRARLSKGQSVTGIVLGSLAVVASLGMTVGVASVAPRISADAPLVAQSTVEPTATPPAQPSPTATTPPAPTPTVPPAPPAPAAPAVPAEFTSALRKAGSYSSMMHMSKAGIYDQLTSQYGEKFSAEAAQYAIDNVAADWGANALAKAKSYQSQMSMSPEAIRDQLVSEYGEKFTPEEADYAVQHLND